MAKTIITVTSLKGGVGKSTTSVHLAAFFQRTSSTLLVDADPNRSVIEWNQRGGLPFAVITERYLAREAGNYETIIIDTKGRPDPDDLREMIGGSDLIVVPCFPEAQAIATLRLIHDQFRALATNKYRILLTNIPPLPQQDGPEYRALLTEFGMPLFSTNIRSLKAFKRASQFGTTVEKTKDTLARLGWADYEAIGEEILSILADHEQQGTAGSTREILQKASNQGVVNIQEGVIA
jgi:chromosome partitioning protein